MFIRISSTIGLILATLIAQHGHINNDSDILTAGVLLIFMQYAILIFAGEDK